MAQSVKYPTLDFGSGHDLRVVRLSPKLGSVLGVEPALASLFLSALPPRWCALSLSKKKKKKKVNGLNAPSKRHRVTEWIKTTTNKNYMLLLRDSLWNKDPYRPKVK